MPKRSNPPPLTDAQQAIVASNLGLVGAMLKRANVSEHLEADARDAAVDALMRCSRRFDPTRGFQFSTYACRAILNAISRAYTTNRRQDTRYLVASNSVAAGLGLELAAAPDDLGETDESARRLRHRIGMLDKRSRLVIKRRFGIDCERAKLDVIAVEIGVSRQRVHQIQVRAMASLRRLMAA